MDWQQRAIEAEGKLMDLWDEYESQKSQFGENVHWNKHENKAQIQRIERHIEWVREDWDAS